MEKSQHPKPEIIGAEMFAYEKPGLKVLPYTNNRYALAKDDFKLLTITSILDVSSLVNIVTGTASYLLSILVK